MAKKDTHLTQTGAEVQRILNEAQRVYQCPLADVPNPDEGDLCLAPGPETEIVISPVSGATYFNFNSPNHRVKWEVTGGGTAWFRIEWYEMTPSGGVGGETPMLPESETALMGYVNIPTSSGDAAINWLSSGNTSKLQYLKLYDVAPSTAYEYHNGEWVNRSFMTEDSLFIAVIGQESGNTPYSELRQAIDEGKYIVGEWYGDYFVLTSVLTNRVIFTHQQNDFVQTIWVEESSFRVSLRQHENVFNKVQEVDEDSTEDDYPSAKAVYNAIKDAATAGMSYDSITESIVVEPPHGSYDQSTETITL